MTNQIMIDIETFDTKNTAVILSIGAVRFNIENKKIFEDDAFYTTMKIEDQKLQGRTISTDTMLWWMSQSQEAKNETFTEVTLLDIALQSLRSWIPSKSPVWANSPTFDLSILRHAYESFEIKCPWHYRDERDCRTMYALAKDLELSLDTTEAHTAHNALSDAIKQAGHMIQIYQRLND